MECSPNPPAILPTEPGLHHVDIDTYIDPLFALDTEIAAVTPTLIAFETPQDLANFLVVEHDSESYILNNDAGELVGYLSVIGANDNDHMEVLNIAVAPQAQGTGNGRILIEHAESLARNAQKRRLTLVTSVKNEQAIGFYERLGFAPIKTIDNYYGDGETRVLFEKPLL